MLSFNLLVIVCLSYVAFLFAVAFWAEKRAERGRFGWLHSPFVYTLSLSIYCTAWTFFGAVGNAARSGLEFLPIYLGPTLVLIGWWALLRKLVRIGRTQRLTSIADLISSRYGKSNLLGVLVTLMAVVGTTPYIALQLQSVTLSFAVFAAHHPPDEPELWAFADVNRTAFIVAIGLAVFTLIFGTRNLDVNERHSGIVTAIAVEAVVKLMALVAVGVFVIWTVAGGVPETLQWINESPISTWEISGSRWMTLTFLSAAAFICLPRMFQVLVVENSNDRQVAMASWAFPLYLFAMSLFVVPIAVVGLRLLPEGANSDLFVLTVPLELGREGLAMLSFLGGFSSATSMVIVASLALATMLSNNVVVPLWLWAVPQRATVSGDVRLLVLRARRVSIVALALMGYLYYRMSGGGAALTSIGLISFAGVSQVLPALIGALFWRGATRVGAVAGVTIGFAVWLYTLFLPSFGEDAIFSARTLTEGPWGIGLLRPQALFGIAGLDPLVHAVFWSMTLNGTAFLVGSLLSFPSPLERLQGAEFVNVFRYGGGRLGWSGQVAEAEDLLMMAQRILGTTDAQALFQAEAARQGKQGYLPDTTPEFLERLERKLAGSVGAATAHAMVGQITGGSSVSVEELMRVADETAQIMEYSNQLEAKSEELTRTARQLREANEKLTQLSIQKDAFLSQISHELRTPMTSIRAFSEILRDGGMTEEERQKFSGVIHDEALRLTRLLDDLLDLSVLENGQVTLNIEAVWLDEVIDRSVAAVQPGPPGKGGLIIERNPGNERRMVHTDPDRLAQVFINLISNAQKYCTAAEPRLKIVVRAAGASVTVDFIDNGEGVPRDSQALVFEKFARLTDTRAAGGAGLGLAICREIMARLGGDISYVPGQGGAAFRVVVPLTTAKAA